MRTLKGLWQVAQRCSRLFFFAGLDSRCKGSSHEKVTTPLRDLQQVFLSQACAKKKQKRFTGSSSTAVALKGSWSPVRRGWALGVWHGCDRRNTFFMATFWPDGFCSAEFPSRNDVLSLYGRKGCPARSCDKNQPTYWRSSETSSSCWKDIRTCKFGYYILKTSFSIGIFACLSEKRRIGDVAFPSTRTMAFEPG